jgi:uncharacterized protein YlxW (UPF0749 family)
MDVLRQVLREAVDPDYAMAAPRAPAPRRVRWLLAAATLLVGVLFTVGAVQTTRTAPAMESERSELIALARDAETNQDRLRSQVTALDADIDGLRAAALGGDETSRWLEQQIDTLDPIVGHVAVGGPGLLVVVDDAPGSDRDTRDRVLDLDLQVLVNGLWQAGAEAVAVNGHRLSALTAIRGAGEAITVDYRSLTRPYRVEAVGDPRTLPSRWIESSAGSWWNELAQNRQMRYEVSEVGDLTLPADPGLVLRHARGAS